MATERKEVVALLSLADRTHSQLLDAVPEKTGLAHSNHAAEVHANLENVISEVALFRNPQFEAAHSGLSQGNYTLKGFSFISALPLI